MVACDGDQAAAALAGAPGFTWRGLGRRLFAEHGDRLVDLYDLAEASRQRATGTPQVVTWEPDDPLSMLFTVVFGRLGNETSRAAMLSDAVHKLVTARRIAPTDAVPGDAGWLPGYLSLGSHHINFHNRMSVFGVVVLDPLNPSHLIDYWNLRAMGHAVAPWPIRDPDRLSEFVLTHIRAAVGRDDRGNSLTVFTEDEEVPVGLAKLLRSVGAVRPRLVHRDWRTQLDLSSAITTSLRTMFDAELVGSRETGYFIEVPIPRADIAAREDRLELGPVACLRVTVDNEQNIPEQISFRAPAIRELAPALARTVSFIAPVVRGVDDGVVVACRLRDKIVDLGPTDSTYIIQNVLALAGIETTCGDAGRWMIRVIEALGGSSSSLASQPAVRHVLDLAAAPSGATPESLRSVAAREAGLWPDAVVHDGQTSSYPAAVLASLASRRLLTPSLHYRCPGCGLGQSLDPDRAQLLLRCEDCEAESPLALEILRGAQWRLGTRRLLTRDKLRATYPVLSSLRLLVEAAGRDRLHYALGLDFSSDDASLDIDYAVLFPSDHTPTLILGEAKSAGELPLRTIEALERLQEMVRANGVECVIAFSTSRESLTAPEVARLRQSAERGLMNVRSAGDHTVFLNLPLILTRRALTTPHLSEDNPAMLASSSGQGLSALARWSCARELGLTSTGLPGETVFEWRESGPT